MTIGKIFKTLSAATLFNTITACIASDDLGKAFDALAKAKNIEDKHSIDIIAPIAAGFTLSTGPAIAMTIITKILSLNSTIGTLSGGLATWFGYDEYLKFAFPQSQTLINNGTNKVLNLVYKVRAEITKAPEDIYKAASYKINNQISSYEQKVISSTYMQYFYKLSTIVQTWAFNSIWAQDAQEDITHELQENITQEPCQDL